MRENTRTLGSDVQGEVARGEAGSQGSRRDPDKKEWGDDRQTPPTPHGPTSYPIGEDE